MINYYRLTTENRQDIEKDMKSRLSHYKADPFSYYINNAVSIYRCPKWIGSVACDFIYNLSDRFGRAINDDMIGWYVNEIVYSYGEYWNTEEELLDCMIKYIVPEELQEEFKRMKGRYI